MSKPLIPFGWFPSHWGLTGRPRDLAKVYYELEGYDCEVEAAKILYPERTAQLLRINEINYNYDKITLDEMELESIKISNTGKDLEIGLAQYDLKHGKITETEHDKKVATINETPWVLIKQLEYDPESPSQGSMELDWNDFFIKDLKSAGYDGVDDEEIVDKWLNELCRNIAVDAFSGIGDFDDMVEVPEVPRKVDGKWEAS